MDWNWLLYGWFHDRTWSDWWAAIQGLALCATTYVAWYQIGALRREQELRRKDEKAWRTLEACERYESDTVIASALKTLARARNSNKLLEDPVTYRVPVVTLLNYFEGIAIAAEQGFYVESIVRVHLEPMMRDHVLEFCADEAARKMKLPVKEFNRLYVLLDKWAAKPISLEV
jgi:hypothetical protein